jgi:hypothetical protein
MGANDRPAIFVRGKALAACFCGALFHGRVQSNTFNRADFRKAGAAQDESGFAAFSGRALLLWHAGNLSHIFLFATPSRIKWPTEDASERRKGLRKQLTQFLHERNCHPGKTREEAAMKRYLIFGALGPLLGGF